MKCFNLKNLTKTEGLLVAFLLAYALLSCAISLFYLWTGHAMSELRWYMLVYFCLPSLLFFSLVLQRFRRIGTAVCLVYFAALIIRYVGADAHWPWNPPITLSIPITSFASGNGYLVDIIPLTLVIVIAHRYYRVFRR